MSDHGRLTVRQTQHMYSTVELLLCFFFLFLIKLNRALPSLTCEVVTWLVSAMLLGWVISINKSKVRIIIRL